MTKTVVRPPAQVSSGDSGQPAVEPSRWPSAAPIVVIVAYKVYILVAGNLGSRVDIVQVAVLAGTTLVVLLGVVEVLRRTRLDATRVAFAVATFLWLSTQSTWLALGALTGSLAGAVLTALVIPLAGTAACYGLRNPGFRSLVLAFIVLSGVLPTVGPILDLVGSEPSINPSAVDFGDPTEELDLIIVVLDEYARGDALAADYDFDNQEFTDALSMEGIDVVPEAWANSTRTITSMATALSGQHLVEPGQTYNLRDRRRITRLLGGDNPMAAFLRDNGYRHTHIEGPAVDVECSNGPDVCIGNGLRDETTTAWFQSNPYVGLVTLAFGHPFPNTADDILKTLGSVVDDAATNDRPDFIYAHVLSPHIPWELDASCQQHQMFDEDNTYVGQVQCVNRLVLEALAGSVDDAIVIITGDHGTVEDRAVLDGDPTLWTREQVGQRLGVFSAVKLAPGCTEPHDDATLVVIFHLAAACALGVEPDPPSERTFIVEGIPADTDSIVEIDLDELRTSTNR